MKYAIEMQGVTKCYEGFAIENLNFVLPSGCIMGLIGENGAGKTTTIKLILNMIQKDSGNITVLGVNENESFQLVKEDIGVVLDEVGFPECLTATQVNRMMSYTYKNWDETVFFDYLQKLSVPEKKAFKDFSKGMKMKLGIAVALSHNPKLLILDEATSGLDPVVRDEILDIFSEFTRDENHSILISSHIVSDLEKICDYIAFLHQGKLMLLEEKDLLLEEYGIIHCSAQQLEELNPEALKGKKQSPYGVEAIIRKDLVPIGMDISPITIEELFIFMVKEVK